MSTIKNKPEKYRFSSRGIVFLRRSLMKKWLISFILLQSLLLACGSKENGPDHIKKMKIALRRKTPAALLTTLGKIIRYGREELLYQLYTKKSIKALDYNRKQGIGSAGTIDGFLREEISLWHARSGAADSMKKKRRKKRKDLKNKKTKKRGNRKRVLKKSLKKIVFHPPAVVHVRRNLFLVKWPSGTRFPILIVKNGAGKWLIDVFNGPGGKILLLRK